ncbi:ABCA1 [Symbiodinium microadriaticum]|nr:ABCA1 [Symbiodinium microadriaticum]
MTGRETLWFFGRVRGIATDMLERRCASLIQQVGLARYADKPCGSYSGGNKRKLSLAVALVGNPKVLFLDEPSSGMDPESRRHMWEVIAQVSADRFVVMTTHSMEECEAICTRVGIMVSGRLQCLGSCHHLKERFGAGYQVDVSTNSDEKRRESLSAIFAEKDSALAGAVVEEEHAGYFRLRVSNEVDLAQAFTLLENIKQRGLVLDYSVSQGTLEQIFINFAKDQEEERGQHTNE